jgi:hypothetical protein
MGLRTVPKNSVRTGSKASFLQHLAANTTVANAHLLENGGCWLWHFSEFSDRISDVNDPRSQAPFYEKYPFPQKPAQ